MASRAADALRRREGDAMDASSDGPRGPRLRGQLLVLRGRAGLTQRALAAQLGISEKAIAHWEAGRGYPSAARQQALIALYVARGVFAAGHEAEDDDAAAHTFLENLAGESRHVRERRDLCDVVEGVGGDIPRQVFPGSAPPVRRAQHRVDAQPDSPVHQIMAFDVVRRESEDSQVPAVLRPIARIPRSLAVRERTFEFDLDGVYFTINSRTWNRNRVDADPRVNTAEIWHLVNGGDGWVHPIHIHLVRFLVLGVQGRPNGGRSSPGHQPHNAQGVVHSVQLGGTGGHP